jgi:hypothetical protein
MGTWTIIAKDRDEMTSWGCGLLNEVVEIAGIDGELWGRVVTIANAEQVATTVNFDVSSCLVHFGNTDPQDMRLTSLGTQFAALLQVEKQAGCIPIPLSSTLTPWTFAIEPARKILEGRTCDLEKVAVAECGRLLNLAKRVSDNYFRWALVPSKVAALHKSKSFKDSFPAQQLLQIARTTADIFETLDLATENRGYSVNETAVITCTTELRKTVSADSVSALLIAFAALNVEYALTFNTGKS